MALFESAHRAFLNSSPLQSGPVFLELQGITLIHNNVPLAVINIYRYPNQFTLFSTLDRFLQFFYGKLENVIITEDVNAHHPWWGCDYEDNAGKTLSRLIDIYDLVIVNDRLHHSSFPQC